MLFQMKHALISISITVTTPRTILLALAIVMIITIIDLLLSSLLLDLSSPIIVFDIFCLYHVMSI